MSSIQTVSGQIVELVNPDPEQIYIHDIAHALSQICRFAGHSSRFYSVAAHSVLVSHRVPPEYALEGLLHDASEAYIGDISRPLKRALPEYQVIEARWEAAIAKRFRLDTRPGVHHYVKKADNEALSIEAAYLMRPDDEYWAINVGQPKEMSPPTRFLLHLTHAGAYMIFINRFNELMEGRHARNAS